VPLSLCNCAFANAGYRKRDPGAAAMANPRRDWTLLTRPRRCLTLSVFRFSGCQTSLLALSLHLVAHGTQSSRRLSWEYMSFAYRRSRAQTCGQGARYRYGGWQRWDGRLSCVCSNFYTWSWERCPDSTAVERSPMNGWSAPLYLYPQIEGIS
jgi:hypothetical protein